MTFSNNYNLSQKDYESNETHWVLPGNQEDIDLDAYQELFSEVVGDLRDVNYVGTLKKGTYQLLSGEWVNIPFSVAFTEDGKEILLLNRQLGAGCKTAAKVCWDLRQGEYLVKRALAHPIAGREEKIYDMLQGASNVMHATTFRRQASPHWLSFLGLGPRGKEQVFEPLMQGDLGALLSKSELSTPQKIDILYQLTRGLKEMHSKGTLHQLSPEGWMSQAELVQAPLYHGDIKADNVLYTMGENDQIEVRLADFNLSMYVEQELRNNCTLSPEACLAKSLDDRSRALSLAHWGTKLDIWALGLLFAEVLGGNQPILQDEDCGYFENEKHGQLYKYDAKRLSQLDSLVATRVSERKDTALENGDPVLAECWDLLPQMLVADPKQRLSARELFDKLEKILETIL